MVGRVVGRWSGVGLCWVVCGVEGGGVEVRGVGWRRVIGDGGVVAG